MPGWVRVNLVTLGGIEIRSRLEQPGAEGDRLFVRGPRVVDVEVEMHLLGSPVRPVGRNANPPGRRSADAAGKPSGANWRRYAAANNRCLTRAIPGDGAAGEENRIFMTTNLLAAAVSATKVDRVMLAVVDGDLCTSRQHSPTQLDTLGSPCSKVRVADSRRERMHPHRFTRAWHRCVLALAAALAFAWVAAPLGTAQASTAAQTSAVAPMSKSQCPGHSFCMWQNYDYNNTVSGGFWSYTYNNPWGILEWYYVGDNANDKATSIFNNRGWRTGINKDVNPASTVDVYCRAGGYYDSDLVGNHWPDGSSENDSISAFWFSYDNTSCYF
jgi:hypothetical protein